MESCGLWSKKCSTNSGVTRSNLSAYAFAAALPKSANLTDIRLPRIVVGFTRRSDVAQPNP